VIVSWNLTSHVNKYRNADVLVLSIAGSGRTWLRVLLNKYLSLHYNVPFAVADLSALNDDIPSIRFDHEMWRHYCDATWLARLLGRNIIPPTLLRRKGIILLYRDPRDVLVSLYFHMIGRGRRPVDPNIRAFIRCRDYGADNVIRVMNVWHRRLVQHPRCFWLSYESLKGDTNGELTRLLSFIGIDDVSPAFVGEAVAFSEFDNMKRMEANDEFGSDILRPRNPCDPNSFKVREGVVGSHRKYLRPADLEYLDGSLRLLHPSYRYS
jgi:hypothetical protein